MFGYAIDLNDFVAKAREALAPHWRGMAGAFFTVLALVAIEYDEFVAPSVNRISEAWSATAKDFSGKLTSFTL